MLIAKYVSLFVLAATKFLAAVLLLFADNSITTLETFLVLFLGGIIGMVVFYYLGKLINNGVDFLFVWLKIKKTSKKKFTKSNRRIVFLKNKYGLVGITTLTPILLSIPLGCFLASRFYEKKPNTIFIMLLGVIIWTIIFTGIKAILL